MAEPVTITIESSTRDTLVGKAIVVALMGCLTGYAFTGNQAAEHEQAVKMTVEAYAEGFYAYKAKHEKKPPTIYMGIVIFLVAGAGVCSAYEVSGRLLGLAIGRALGWGTRRSPDERPTTYIGNR